MNEHDDPIQFQLGQLTGQAEGLQGWVKNLAEKLEDNTKVVTDMAALVSGLPCAERREACQREMGGLRKMLNGQTEAGRAASVRRWGVLGAIFGGVIVGGLDLVSRFYWR